MLGKKENPAALAGADRVDVTMLAGSVDVENTTPTAIDQQLRRLLGHYAVSLPLALVIAEHAFASGRRR